MRVQIAATNPARGDLDDLIKWAEDAKEKGANEITIEGGCDPSWPEPFLRAYKVLTKEEIKQQRIAELENELNQLKTKKMIVKTKYFGVFRIDDILRISPFVVEKYTEGKKHIGFTVSYRSQPDYGWYRIIEDAALTIEKRRQDYENFVDAVCNASEPEDEIEGMKGRHSDIQERLNNLPKGDMLSTYEGRAVWQDILKYHFDRVKNEGLANLAKHTNET